MSETIVRRADELTIKQLKDQLTEKDKQNEELQEQNEYLNNLVKEKEQRGLEIQEDLLKEKAELEAQIEKMKSDIKQLRENRRNDDTDQNIIDRLWKEWDVLIGVSN